MATSSSNFYNYHNPPNTSSALHGSQEKSNTDVLLADGFYTIEKDAIGSVRQLCLVKNRTWGKDDVIIEDRGNFGIEKPWYISLLATKGYRDRPNYSRLVTIMDPKTGHYLAHPPSRPEDRTRSSDLGHYNTLYICPGFHKDLAMWEITPSGNIRMPFEVEEDEYIVVTVDGAGHSGHDSQPMVLSCFVETTNDNKDKHSEFKPTLKPLGTRFQHQTWRLRSPSEYWHEYRELSSGDIFKGFLVLCGIIVYFFSDNESSPSR